MGFLNASRATFERALPQLASALATRSPEEWEADRSGAAIAQFKALDGPGLLIPTDLGGVGASPVEAVRLQRAVGAAAPSLAVATTMHHFSVAVLLEISDSGLDALLIEAIARNRLVVASGFAEGVPRAGPLSPTMKATSRGSGVVLNGVKRPCSLSRSMDLLTVSAVVDGRMAVILVPAGLDGIEVRDFWTAPVLAAAESGEVVLTDVEVPSKMVSYSGDPAALDAAQIGALTWFECLISASYVGIASILVERLVEKADSERRRVAAPLVGELGTAMLAIEAVAASLMLPARDDWLLVQALMMRSTVERLVSNVSTEAFRLLGGRSFATGSSSLLLATAQALYFHPPPRDVASAALADWLGGAPLLLP